MDIIRPEQEQEENEQPVRDIDRNEFVPTREKSSGVFYLIIGIIAIIVSVAASIFVLYGDKLPSVFSRKSPTPTPIASSSATSSPEATASSTSTASVVASSSPSSQAENSSFASRKVRIVNGNGITGEAGTVKIALEKAGFTIESTGNASKTYVKTTIYYNGDGNKDLAESLNDSLPAAYEGAELIKSETVSGVYDAIVALGNKN